MFIHHAYGPPIGSRLNNDASLRDYYNNMETAQLKVFNNGEIAIVYRTLEELDAYGKIVLKFEEHCREENNNHYKYGLDTLPYN